MGFKNFDKPDDEKVENVEKTDEKSEGEKQNIADKIKEFFTGKGKEGNEESNEGKEDKENKESKEDKNENKEKNSGEKKWWDLSPEEMKKVDDYNKELSDKFKNEQDNKQDAGNNSEDEAPNKGQIERGMKPNMENKEEQKNKDDELEL